MLGGRLQRVSWLNNHRLNYTSNNYVRHYEPGRRSNLFPYTKIQLIKFLLLFFFIPVLAQTPQETIKIGFLIRDKGDMAIQQKAQLAIDEANAKGGYKGRNFELITKSCDGPWGVTSKQTVDLIFEDQVLVVVTALDGRNAHLVEQVTAKSHVVMISTLSSDPTLSRAYVPWYFRVVPDDKQQAIALVDEIYIKNKAQHVAMISLDAYDGQKSSEAFLAKVKQKGLQTPSVFMDSNEDELLKKIQQNSWDAVVFAGSSTDNIQIADLIKNQNSYAFINFFNFMESNDDVINVKTSFSPSLDYVYDGILLAVESIIQYGPDAEEIRIGFKDLKYDGVTGKIEFDKLGNRILE